MFKYGTLGSTVRIGEVAEDIAERIFLLERDPDRTSIFRQRSQYSVRQIEPGRAGCLNQRVGRDNRCARFGDDNEFLLVGQMGYVDHGSTRPSL